MTHSLDFVGLNEKLFLLRHLVAGNKEFSRRERQYQGTQAEPSVDWDEYAGRLRYIVSNDLLEIAAKFRVIQDAAAAQVPANYLREMDAEYNDRIGHVLDGDVKLNLRESCNKIIHAKKFELVFQNARSGVPRQIYSFWNGICRLTGSQAKNSWRVALDVYRWSEAMDSFLNDLSHEVDW